MLTFVSTKKLSTFAKGNCFKGTNVNEDAASPGTFVHAVKIEIAAMVARW